MTMRHCSASEHVVASSSSNGSSVASSSASTGRAVSTALRLSSDANRLRSKACPTRHNVLTPAYSKETHRQSESTRAGASAGSYIYNDSGAATSGTLSPSRGTSPSRDAPSVVQRSLNVLLQDIAQTRQSVSSNAHAPSLMSHESTVILTDQPPLTSSHAPPLRSQTSLSSYVNKSQFAQYKNQHKDSKNYSQLTRKSCSYETDCSSARDTFADFGSQPSSIRSSASMSQPVPVTHPPENLTRNEWTSQTNQRARSSKDDTTYGVDTSTSTDTMSDTAPVESRTPARHPRTQTLTRAATQCPATRDKKRHTSQFPISLSPPTQQQQQQQPSSHKQHETETTRTTAKAPMGTKTTTQSFSDLSSYNNTSIHTNNIDAAVDGRDSCYTDRSSSCMHGSTHDGKTSDTSAVHARPLSSDAQPHHRLQALLHEYRSALDAEHTRRCHQLDEREAARTQSFLGALREERDRALRQRQKSQSELGAAQSALTRSAVQQLDELKSALDAESERHRREWLAQLQQTHTHALAEQKKLFAQALARARSSASGSHVWLDGNDNKNSYNKSNHARAVQQQQLLQSQVSSLQSQLAEAVAALSSERAAQEQRIATRVADTRAAWESGWRERLTQSRHTYTAALAALTQEMHTALSRLREESAQQQSDVEVAVQQCRQLTEHAMEQTYRGRLQTAETLANAQTHTIQSLRAHNAELAQQIRQLTISALNRTASHSTKLTSMPSSPNSSSARSLSIIGLDGNSNKAEELDEKNSYGSDEADELTLSQPESPEKFMYASVLQLMCAHQRQREELWLTARAAEWAMYKQMHQQERDLFQHAAEKSNESMRAMTAAHAQELQRTLTEQSLQLQRDWGHVHRAITAQTNRLAARAWGQVKCELDHAWAATRAELQAVSDALPKLDTTTTHLTTSNSSVDALWNVREREMVTRYEGQLTRLRESSARELSEQRARWQRETETLLREAHETYDVQMRELRRAYQCRSDDNSPYCEPHDLHRNAKDATDSSDNSKSTDISDENSKNNGMLHRTDSYVRDSVKNGTTRSVPAAAAKSTLSLPSSQSHEQPKQDSISTCEHKYRSALTKHAQDVKEERVGYTDSAAPLFVEQSSPLPSETATTHKGPQPPCDLNDAGNAKQDSAAVEQSMWNTVYRLCEVLEVPTQDRIELQHHVRMAVTQSERCALLAAAMQRWESQLPLMELVTRRAYLCEQLLRGSTAQQAGSQQDWSSSDTCEAAARVAELRAEVNRLSTQLSIDAAAYERRTGEVFCVQGQPIWKVLTITPPSHSVMRSVSVDD